MAQLTLLGNSTFSACDGPTERIVGSHLEIWLNFNHIFADHFRLKFAIKRWSLVNYSRNSDLSNKPPFVLLTPRFMTL
jgi:hypothetical protein